MRDNTRVRPCRHSAAAPLAIIVIVGVFTVGSAAVLAAADEQQAARAPDRTAATQPARGEIVIRPVGKRRVVNVTPPPKVTRDADGTEHTARSVRLPLGYTRDEMVAGYGEPALYLPLRDEAPGYPGYGYGGYLTAIYNHAFNYGRRYGHGYGYDHGYGYGGYGHHGGPVVERAPGHIPGYGYGSGYGFHGTTHSAPAARWTPSSGHRSGGSVGGGSGGSRGGSSSRGGSWSGRR